MVHVRGRPLRAVPRSEDMRAVCEAQAAPLQAAPPRKVLQIAVEHEPLLQAAREVWQIAVAHEARLQAAAVTAAHIGQLRRHWA